MQTTTTSTSGNRATGRSARARKRRPGSDLEDILGAVSDRPDLEKLFLRNVSLADILRLAGRKVDPSRVALLVESRHLRRDLRRLLDS